MLFGCRPANIIITGTARNPIPADQVVLYNSQTIPENYKIIGTMNVTSESSMGTKGAQNRSIEKLKKKAAGVGANGLLIENAQKSRSLLDSYLEISATAVYVPLN